MRNRVSKTPFEASSLPRNRKELFGDIFKNQWRLLLLLSLFLFLGLLPFMACLYLRDHAALSASIALSKGEIDEATRESYARSAYFYASLGEVVSLFLFAIPLSGSLRVFRQLMWLEPVFLKEDFRQGIKDNYGNCAMAALLVGVVLIGSKAMLFTAFSNAYLIAAVLGLFVAFLLPPILLAIAQGTVYAGKFSHFLRNGMLLYLKNAPLLILFTLVLCSPFLLELIQNAMAVRYILMAVLSFIAPAIGILLFLLASYSVFDRHINLEQYPEIYRKGLYSEETPHES